MRWLLAVTLAASLSAQLKPSDMFKPLEFLIGEWVGEGSGDPGHGSGGFSFEYDLDRKILTRKNYAQYPAQGNRPAYRHDDLMIVYREGNALRAIYFDNEDHVISYSVEPSADSIRFISSPVADQPRYRLTYRKTSGNAVALDFEIAPPGKPDAFTNYITATVRRKATK
jgi:hypothetical protein